MKICYYNWVDYRDNRGGGVTVYQRNIINNIDSKHNKIYYISSGVYYSLKAKDPFFTRKKNIFRIYNSETIAPAHSSYGSVSQLEGKKTCKVFLDIIAACKGFDIIHFNNIEGIPVSVFQAIKKAYPQIKIILSIHNYYSFCSQVNLWHDESVNCKDYREGRSCIICARPYQGESFIKKDLFLYQLLKDLKIREGGFLFGKTYQFCFKINDIRHKFVHVTNKAIHIKNIIKDNVPFRQKNRTSSKDKKSASLINTEPKIEYFKRRRNFFVSAINEHVDTVICVSRRVKEICIKFGIHREKCKVLYIGTEHYKFFEKQSFPIGKKRKDVFTIGYLGYMRRDKGFEFLLHALKHIDDSLSKNIKLVVAARRVDHLLDDLIRTSRKFHSLEYYDGYNHDSLDVILENVDLGIIPPLWEDNLPQVAIEIHSRKIPLLTSNTGGASELHRSNNNFVFKSGDIWDFKDKLEDLVKNGIDYEGYFSNILYPISTKAHIKELFQVYQGY